MSKDDSVELEGEVTDVLPNSMFKVRLQNGKEILAYLSGKLRMNYIKILQGDFVKVDISLYDLTRGRITWRMKGSPKPATQPADVTTVPSTEATAVPSTEATAVPDASSVSDIKEKNLNTIENSKSDNIDTSNLVKNR